MVLLYISGYLLSNQSLNEKNINAPLYWSQLGISIS